MSQLKDIPARSIDLGNWTKSLCGGCRNQLQPFLQTVRMNGQGVGVSNIDKAPLTFHDDEK
jgi:hypothetical protein